MPTWETTGVQPTHPSSGDRPPCFILPTRKPGLRPVDTRQRRVTFFRMGLLGGCYLLLLPVGQSQVTTPVFGSANGYDAGGDAPLCWASEFRPNSTNNPPSKNYTNRLDQLNDWLFEGVDQVDKLRLLPSCPNGWGLTVDWWHAPNPFDGGEDPDRYYIGETYTFTIFLQLLSSTYLSPFEDNNNNDNTLSPLFAEDNNSTSTTPVWSAAKYVYVQLQLCDALRQGFCNPMRDTRTTAASWTPQQTDLSKSSSSKSLPAQFPDNATKWAYDPQTTTLLGLPTTENNWTLVSRWVQWPLDNYDDLYSVTLNISFQIPPSLRVRRGSYYIIAHAVLELDANTSADTNGRWVDRLDLSQAIRNKVVELQAPPKILGVATEMKAWIGVASGLLGGLALAMLVFLIYHRHHEVIRLAQGALLSAMTGGCLVQVAFTYTFLPLEDINCQLRGPLVTLPLTFVAAVMVGRVWRVYRTLGAAQQWGRSKLGEPAGKKCDLSLPFLALMDWLATVPFCITCLNRRPRPNNFSIRRTASIRETLNLIVVLTFPQFFLQIFASFYYQSTASLAINDAQNAGRVRCSVESRWVLVAGTAYAGFVYLLAVSMAWISRLLPSAFNEKDQIFQAATVCAILAFIAIVLGQMTNDPSIDPDIVVFIRSTFSFGTAASVLFLLILPKVRRVRSGEKLVMSALLESRYQGSSSAKPPSSDEQSVGLESMRELAAGTPEAKRRSSYSAADSAQAPTAKMVVLRIDDPIPRRVERHIFEVQVVLRDAVERFGDGRPLELSHWDRMREEVSLLKGDLDLIVFAAEEESNENEVEHSQSSHR